MSDALAAARAALRARQGAGARYDAAAAPARELGWARLGTAYLARKLNELTDADLDASRRRIVAEVGLQARAMAQALEAATGKESDEWAETGPQALALAGTLPARALRHLVAHADVHLNVVWRDLTDTDWDLPVEIGGRVMPARDTAGLRARTLWTRAVALGNGGRLRDAPADLQALLDVKGP